MSPDRFSHAGNHHTQLAIGRMNAVICSVIGVVHGECRPICAAP